MSKNHKTALKRARRKRYIKRKTKELNARLKLNKTGKPVPKTAVAAPEPVAGE